LVVAPGEAMAHAAEVTPCVSFEMSCPSMHINYDASSNPVRVTITTTAEPPGEVCIDVVVRFLDRLVELNRCYICVIDCRVYAVPPFMVVKTFMYWLRDNLDGIEPLGLATAVVLEDSVWTTAARGCLSMAFHIVPPVCPVRVCGSVEEAWGFVRHEATTSHRVLRHGHSSFVTVFEDGMDDLYMAPDHDEQSIATSDARSDFDTVFSGGSSTAECSEPVFEHTRAAWPSNCSATESGGSTPRVVGPGASAIRPTIDLDKPRTARVSSSMVACCTARDTHSDPACSIM